MSRTVFFLYLLLAAGMSCQTRAASAQDEQSRAEPIRYVTRIEGLNGTGLKGLLESVSELKRQEAQPPLSFGNLRSRLNRDLKIFKEVLESEGYYNSLIANRIDRSRRPIDITIDVAPGPLYRIKTAEISYSGTAPDAATRQTVADHMALTEKAPGRSEDIVNAGRRLVSTLPEIGYPFAKAGKRTVVVDHADQSLQVTYEIDAGPETRFGSALFEGAGSVSTVYLKRLISWQQGEIFDQRKIDKLRARLYVTGLFSVVDIRVAEEGAGASRDIIVRLAEAEHRTIGVGAGFSSTEGFGGDVFWEHRNLLGRQEKLRLTAKVAEIEQSLTANFSKPNFRRFDQTLLLQTGFAREDTDAFNSRTAEASAGIDRVFGERWAGSVGVDLEYTSETDGDERRNFLLTGLPVTIRWDSTNDLLDPRKGGRVAFRTTPYLAEQNSPFHFTVTEISASAYLPVDDEERFIIAGRTRLGTINGASLERLPATKRFYAGGGGSIRGFGFQEVGPRDAEGDPSGGRSLVELGLEFRARITETIGLVPFIESGNVYEQRLPQFSSLRFGAGLGFRYYTSFAPIRFDIAFPLDRREGDRRIQFYISLGQSF